MGLDRRRFLFGSGVSLTMPMFQRDVVAATADAVPKRMVFVANPLGFVPDQFFPSQPGDLRPETLSPLLQPFAGMVDRVSVLQHLDHGTSGGHQGVHAFLSGIRDNESSGYDARNLTVDQRAAESVSGQTRFSSIVAAVGRNSGELECRTSWTRDGVNIPPVTDPRKLFESLFVSTDANERASLRGEMARHQSVLDAIGESARQVHRELGQHDRRKLDEYLTSVRSVERRLQSRQQWIDKPKPSVDLKLPSDDAPLTRTLPLFYDLIRLALQTDSTRVATLAIPGNLPVGDLGLQGNYHAFSHHGKTDRLLEPLGVIERFQMKKAAEFVRSLSQVQTPDGQSLLDHTMVLCGSGMGNASSHSNRDLPVLLAGGPLRHGRHHVLPSESHRRVPLSNLFTTMLQKFGDHQTERFNRATGTLEILG